MNKNKKIILIVISVVVTLVLINFIVLPFGEYEECVTEIRDHLEYYSNECPDNFKELGFESAERCYEVRVALYDPKPCR
ncbi:MAG: hypothetical protein J4F36_12020 [Nitrosopumilaceae archaeon]|nr:hypothetical protein [Nitrosopumilaceae archaeon]